MSVSFVEIPRLEELRATRGGRVALAGFEYQRAFAVLRLAAMVLQKPIRGCPTVPAWLRYEWAEDVDEASTTGESVLWQCKHGDVWRQPARLAEVLLGFAPKWLWSPNSDRDKLAFRLVTSDRSYAACHDAPGVLDGKDAVCKAFLNQLSEAPKPCSDRALWQADADAAGHGTLFDAVWDATRALYVPGTTTTHDGVAVWAAEQEAVNALALAGKVGDLRQLGAIVTALRALLAVYQPEPADAEGTVARPSLPPRSVLAVDLEHRLFPFRPDSGPELLRVIDRTELELRLEEPAPRAFVARRPEWADVVRGQNETVRFFERTITDKLVETVREALTDARSRQGKLRVQLLTGAPGSGKSTLVLRIAARLVLDGDCVAVDARHSLSQEDELDGLQAALERLASDARPVLLVLDDPLGGDSAWPQLLRKLGRRNPALVVLAATPDFLFDRHRHELRDVHLLSAVDVGRPDRNERRTLASLHHREADRSLTEADEELIVLAMQAAAGTSFDEIIEGIWTTLADQRSTPRAALGSELPWEQAALSAVAFFHRAYAPCPRPLLEALLAPRSDVGPNAVERMAQMEQQQGWRIFQVGTSGRWAYQGGTVSTLHARVARRAWELRPARAWNLFTDLAKASLSVPHVARALALGLVALRDRRVDAAAATMDEVLGVWTSPDATTVETRHFAELVTVLYMSGVTMPTDIWRELTRRASSVEGQSWLAALQLYYLSGEDQVSRAIPSDLAISGIIDAADFSLAPMRASKLYNSLARQSEHQTRFRQRLWNAFDGELRWSLGSSLVTMLISCSPREEVHAHLNSLRVWLRDHPNDTNVRAGFIGLLSGLKSQYRRQIIDDLRVWLREHPDDSHVREKFLAHLAQFPHEAEASDRSEAIAWIRKHPAATNVVTSLLTLLAAHRASELPELLAERLSTFGQDSRFFQPGGAALKAAANVPPRYAAVIAGWLNWAAAVLDGHSGRRSAQLIAGSVSAPLEALGRHLRHPDFPEEAREEAEAALAAVAEARARWYRSVGE